MDITRDLALVDTARAVRLVIRRSEGVREREVPHAVRRRVGVRETTASLVRLGETQGEWLLPAVELPAGEEPLPADEILVDGECWRILSAELRVWGTVWHCVCRRRE